MLFPNTPALAILLLPLLTPSSAQSCPAAYTSYSTFCCSGTLVSSPTGSFPTSGPTIVVPTESLPLPTNTIPTSLPSGLPITPLSTLPVSLPGPPGTLTTFNPLPTSDIIPIPGVSSHSNQGAPPGALGGQGGAVVSGSPVTGSPLTSMPSAAMSGTMSGSVLGPGVTCFGVVSAVSGSGMVSSSGTGVTSFASSTGTGTASGGAGSSGGASSASGASASASSSAASTAGAAGGMRERVGVEAWVGGMVVGVLGWIVAL
ncbi:Invertase [Thelotrema lepadinum]|nr:Invertase [Thelotrema lepadinum]